MKRLRYLSMAAIIFFPMVWGIVAGCSHRAKASAVKFDSAYLIFELDSKVHSTAMAWAICSVRDSSKVVDDAVVRYRDTAWFVQWAVPVADSLRRTLKTEGGRDSTSMQWLSLRKEAILANLGHPKRN